MTTALGARAHDEPAAVSDDARAREQHEEKTHHNGARREEDAPQLAQQQSRGDRTCFGCPGWTWSSSSASSKQQPNSPSSPSPPLAVPEWSRDVARTADTRFHDELARLNDAPQQQRGGGPQQGPPQLHVVTWNTQLLEGVLPGQAGSGAHLRARAAVIATRLLELAGGGAVDVLVLQEVWHAGAADVLRTALSPVFPHVHAPSAFCGLMVLSRRTHPHAGAAFTKFTAVEGIEGHWFSKGVSATVIDVPSPPTAGEEEVRGESWCVIVLNAHTQSDFWKPCAETRTKQFPLMVELLRRCQQDIEAEADEGGSRRRVCGAVLCGDLNVEAGSEEYRDMICAFGDVPDILANVPDIPAASASASASDLYSASFASASSASASAFTFPLGRWSHSLLSAARCRYLRLEPTKAGLYKLNAVYP
jgi:hypothetical protein